MFWDIDAANMIYVAALFTGHYLGPHGDNTLHHYRIFTTMLLELMCGQYLSY